MRAVWTILRRGLESAGEQGLWREVGFIFYILSAEIFDFRGPRAAMEVQREGLDFARRRGDETTDVYLRTAIVEALAAVGDWDEALSEAKVLESQLEERTDSLDLAGIKNLRRASWRSGAFPKRPSGWSPGAGRSVLRRADRGDGRPLVPSRPSSWPRARGGKALRSLSDLARARRRLESHPHVGMAMPMAVMTAIAAGGFELALELTENASPGAGDRCARRSDAHGVAART